MKKALIFTFSRSYNYGANLQAYALRRCICELGWDCKTIDIRSEKQKNNEISLRRDVKGLIINIFTLLKMKKLKEGRKRFNDFDYDVENRVVIECTDGEPDFKKLSAREALADVYIVGSDQVFSPVLMSPLYFLDFDTKGAKKISYAASIGVGNIPKEKEKYYKEHLEEFSTISVREESAKKILSKFVDRDINVNIDPVFLVNKEHWIEIEQPYWNLNADEYIFVYFMYRPKGLNDYLRELHKKTKLPIVLVDTTAFRNIYNNVQILDAGPREFVWLLHHARMVVTSSFHGTAFSIIFEKEFIVFNNPATTERIEQILDRFHLKNHSRGVSKELIGVDFSISQDESRYIYSVIQSEQEKAKLYLKDAMEN